MTIRDRLEGWPIAISGLSRRSLASHRTSTIRQLARWPVAAIFVSVANLDEARNRINISSSQGPTRDGRPKPELAAPGTDIVAANGFDPDKKWVGMTGTSMASPFVAGVIGLMLDRVEPLLTAAQIRGIIQRTARPLPGADFQWRNDAGFDVIDPEACVVEAAAANPERGFDGMKFTTFQSDKGDSVMLTSGDGHHMLVDGGMRDSFTKHVAPHLNRMRPTRRDNRCRLRVAYRPRPRFWPVGDARRHGRLASARASSRPRKSWSS